jgi:hypothetical protein
VPLRLAAGSSPANAPHHAEMQHEFDALDDAQELGAESSRGQQM